jgi:hypothetical protein
VVQQRLRGLVRPRQPRPVQAGHVERAARWHEDHAGLTGFAVVMIYYRKRTVTVRLVRRRGDVIHIAQIADANLLELYYASLSPQLLG